MEKYSGNHPRFSGTSSPLNDNLTNREIRKAEKAGKAYAQSMEVGISEKKRQRKTEKSNKKIMKALGKDTYANKTMQGHVRFREDGLSDKDHEILNVSQKSVEANKKRYIDDDFGKHPYSPGILEKDWDIQPSAEKVIQDRVRQLEKLPKMMEMKVYPLDKLPKMAPYKPEKPLRTGYKVEIEKKIKRLPIMPHHKPIPLPTVKKGG
jgi:hypothetical protein